VAGTASSLPVFLTERWHDLREQEEALKIAETVLVRHDELFRRLAK